MSEPRFRAGEDVLVLTDALEAGPAFEATVMATPFWATSRTGEWTGFFYQLDCAAKPELQWYFLAEKYLRKRPKPGKPFDALMRDLKRPTGRPVRETESA